MSMRVISRYIGFILEIESFFMIPAMLISFFNSENQSFKAFVITILAIYTIGFILRKISKDGDIYAREGFVIVGLGWILISLAGALPFYLSNAIPNYVDCIFETASGFSTTGASILTDVEVLPKGILYWRSFTNWLGGMGVLVFILWIMPIAKGNGETVHILRAESPGPSVGKLVPTVKKTTMYLYEIYIALTVLEFICLMCAGMPLFDAVNTSFSTAGTGGFAVRNVSMGGYSPILQFIIAGFMAAFGVNFSLYYLFLLRRLRTVARNEELRLYVGLIFVSTLLIFSNLMGTAAYDSKPLTAALDSFFQVCSIVTTTGFSTADFNLWPEFSKAIIVMLMFCGAMAGSTGGGFKISRIQILFRYLKSQMNKMLRPRSVKGIFIEKKKVDDEAVSGTLAFFAAYIFIIFISVLIVSIDNFDFTSNFTGVVSCVNNIGPGLNVVGPTGNYAGYSALSKLVFSADMLLGRLEIFPLLMLCFPTFWKKRV